MFKKLNILPLQSQYILSLLLFVVKNIKEFISNSEVHSTNIRNKSDLHAPSIKLTKYKKAVYYSEIKIFNHLPQNIKNLSWNAKKFKLGPKRFLLMGSFYTLDEYFDWISGSSRCSITCFSSMIITHKLRLSHQPFSSRDLKLVFLSNKHSNYIYFNL